MKQLNKQIVKTIQNLRRIDGDASGPHGEEIKRLIVELFDKIRTRAKELERCLEFIPQKRHFIEKVLFWENGAMTNKLHDLREEVLVFRAHSPTNSLTDSRVNVFHNFLLENPRIAIAQK